MQSFNFEFNTKWCYCHDKMLWLISFCQIPVVMVHFPKQLLGICDVLAPTHTSNSRVVQYATPEHQQPTTGNSVTSYHLQHSNKFITCSCSATAAHQHHFISTSLSPVFQQHQLITTIQPHQLIVSLSKNAAHPHQFRNNISSESAEHQQLHTNSSVTPAP